MALPGCTYTRQAKCLFRGEVRDLSWEIPLARVHERPDQRVQRLEHDRRREPAVQAHSAGCVRVASGAGLLLEGNILQMLLDQKK